MAFQFVHHIHMQIPRDSFPFVGILAFMSCVYKNMTEQEMSQQVL